MGNTRMLAADLNQFSVRMGQYYAPLYGTPGAEIARDLSFRLRDALMRPVSKNDLSYEEDEFGNPNQELMSGKETITEELLREKGVDRLVNDTLTRIETELQSDRYPEGSMQRTMLEDMAGSLQQLQRRELINSVNNPEASNLPGYSMHQKNANFVFVPQIANKSVDENGKEKWDYPADFPKDDSDHNFMPRQDQQMFGKYSAEEIRESAERINFNGFMSAGVERLNTMQEVNDLSAMQELTPAQDQAIRERLYASGDRAKAEMERTRQISPEDPVALRAFGDNPGYMSDTILEGGRSFKSDMRGIDEQRRYLESGLPLAGYGEYHRMNNLLNMGDRTVKDLVGKVRGAEDLSLAHELLKDSLEMLPGKGADAGDRHRWQQNVEMYMNQWNVAYERLSNDLNSGALMFQPDVPKQEQEQIRKQFQQGGGLFGLAESLGGECMQDIKELGARTTRERREHTARMMDDMQRDMGTLGAEAAKFGKEDRNLSPELKNALSAVTKANDAHEPATPEAFAKSLEGVRRAAEKSGNQKIADWAANNGAYYQNRMKEAAHRGVLTDEPLAAQRQAMGTQPDAEGKRFQQAFSQFNTKRSGFFKKESNEHMQLRVAGEAFQQARQKLAQTDQRDAAAYAKARKNLAETAEAVSLASEIYQREKGHSASTGAGKDRLAGAEAMKREADAVRLAIKREDALKNRVDAFTRSDPVRQAANSAQRAQERKQGHTRSMSMDDLGKKLGVDKAPQRKTHERKSVAAKPAPVKEGPGMGAK